MGAIGIDTVSDHRRSLNIVGPLNVAQDDDVLRDRPCATISTTSYRLACLHATRRPCSSGLLLEITSLVVFDTDLSWYHAAT
jgi:hypothetical protein